MQPILLLQNITQHISKVDNKSREHNKIQKIRNNLDEVILYEALAKRNDSIMNSCHEWQWQDTFFEKYIVKLKAADEIKRVLEEKQNKKQENIERNSSISSIDPASNQQPENLPSSVDAAGYSMFLATSR
jgi:hypothetical protein